MIMRQTLILFVRHSEGCNSNTKIMFRPRSNSVIESLKMMNRSLEEQLKLTSNVTFLFTHSFVLMMYKTKVQI